MVLPLIIAAAMLGSMAVSGGANLYAQSQQRKIYRKQASAYKGLNEGYERYLKTQGLEMNPDRAWNSYYGQYYKAKKGLDVSYSQSVGTAFGTAGAGLGLSSKTGVYDTPSKTKQWL